MTEAGLGKEIDKILQNELVKFEMTSKFSREDIKMAIHSFIAYYLKV